MELARRAHEKLRTEEERRAASGGIFSNVLSPEERRWYHALGGAQAECKWPACPCPTQSVSGMYHHERWSWIINQARKNPEFSAKDVPWGEHDRMEQGK